MSFTNISISNILYSIWQCYIGLLISFITIADISHIFIMISMIIKMNYLIASITWHFGAGQKGLPALV